MIHDCKTEGVFDQCKSIPSERWITRKGELGNHPSFQNKEKTYEKRKKTDKFVLFVDNKKIPCTQKVHSMPS